MPLKLINPNLELTDFEFDKGFSNPDISDNYQQTLSRMIAYDEPSKLFRFVQVNSDGQLLVSSGASRTDVGNTSKALVGTSAVQILTENSGRKIFNILNNSGVTIWVDFENTVSVDTGFPISAGTNWYEETYYGELWAIALSDDNDMRIMEIG